jgi:hypothetical protein
MEIAADGVLVPATQGSTRPISMIIHGTGPRRTKRYSFLAP